MKNSVIVVQVEAWFEAEEGSTRQKPASAIFQEVLHSIGSFLRWGKGINWSGLGWWASRDPRTRRFDWFQNLHCFCHSWPFSRHLQSHHNWIFQLKKSSKQKFFKFEKFQQHYKMLTPQWGGMKIKSPVRWSYFPAMRFTYFSSKSEFRKNQD